MPRFGESKGEYRGISYRDDAALNAWLAKRPAEAAIEPDLPIIDPHHHFWDRRQRGHYHYLLPELLADIGGGHNIVSTVVLECRAQLAPLGLSFESWQYHPQLPDAIDLARAFPDTTIILNHVGCVLGVGPYSGRRQEILAGWRNDIAEMAKCPNVYCKLGGIGMASFGFDFHERDVPPSSEDLSAAWRQYIEPRIEAFGVRRRMFEANFPPDKQSWASPRLWNESKH